ncbi:acyl-CoA thioesterase [Exiguobacterium sp. s127]|uniref:acyl-CoA thioesterase n=1 Tax=Exiguobacterium sp. s127 TaxID=2751210 RepID=UPI001BEC7612
MRVPSYIEDLDGWLSQMKHGTRLDVAVRFAETDAYGHMNNRVPFVYFEDVRTLMLEETGYSLADDGIVVVADAQCNYIRQVYPRTRLAVYAYPVQVGKASCDVHYAAFDDEEQLMFMGRTSMVQIDRAGNAFPWDKAYKNSLQNRFESVII